MQAIATTHIEQWPIDNLIFYARNLRKNEAAVGRMMAWIREFGFKIPVLARSCTRYRPASTRAPAWEILYRG